MSVVRGLLEQFNRSLLEIVIEQGQLRIAIVVVVMLVDLKRKENKSCDID